MPKSTTGQPTSFTTLEKEKEKVRLKADFSFLINGDRFTKW